MSRLHLALNEIVAARCYTQSLLDGLSESEWFGMPAGGVTHIAWQAGHLAMAQYRLALERLRGAQSGDEQLIAPAILAQFGKDSTPKAAAAQNPPVDELRALMDRVHQRVLDELADYPDGDLDLPPHKPHRLFDTRLGSLFWCARHEMLHAGQIGLLRRLLGKPPQW